MRVAIGGFQHETNTFAASRATLDDFRQADAWPALSRSDNLLTALTGMNIAISGFIDQARKDGHDLVPLVWCAAVPGPAITDPAALNYRKLRPELLLTGHNKFDQTSPTNK